MRKVCRRGPQLQKDVISENVLGNTATLFCYGFPVSLQIAALLKVTVLRRRVVVSSRYPYK